MENNWKEVREKQLNYYVTEVEGQQMIFKDDALNVIKSLMELVFEATKRECADAAEAYKEGAFGNYYGRNDVKVDKESILNIEKPNL